MIDKIISEEVAAEQFDSLLEYYDIEEPEEEGDLKTAFSIIRKKLQRAIQRGRLEIKDTDDDGLEIYQYLVRKYKSMETPVVYRELTGKAKTAMRETTSDDQYGKVYALLGGLTGNGSAQIKNLKGVDLAIAENLGTLFLMV